MSYGNNDSVLEGFFSEFYTTSSLVSISALAVYDYCITFDQEVEKIWKRKFNVLTAVFLINRYATIIVVTGNAAFQLFPHTRLSCLGLWFCISGSILLSQIAIGAFFILRMWAIWGQHFLPLLVLTPMVLGNITFTILYNFPVNYLGIVPPQEPYGGCNVVPSMSHKLLNGFLDAGSALGVVFSFLVLCGTLAKTLELKRVANGAGIKGSLVSLLIRDGTAYLCLSLVLDILEEILSNIEGSTAGIEVIIGPVNRLRPIILSRMILDLRSIDHVSMASLPHIHSSRFGSINFVGNIGAPLNMSRMDENEDDNEGGVLGGAIGSRVSARQLVEDPLSIGLLDEQYDNPDIESEPIRDPIASEVHGDPEASKA